MYKMSQNLQKLAFFNEHVQIYLIHIIEISILKSWKFEKNVITLIGL